MGGMGWIGWKMEPSVLALVGLWWSLGGALGEPWGGFGVALGWLWVSNQLPINRLWCGFALRSICLVYAYYMALRWLWVALPALPATIAFDHDAVM